MTEVRSAADKQDEGWPEPAAVVASNEWMRSRRPFSFSASINVGIYGLYRRSRYGITKHSHTFDFNLDNIPGHHGFRDARSPRVNDVAGQERHISADIAEDLVDRKNQIAGALR